MFNLDDIFQSKDPEQEASLVYELLTAYVTGVRKPHARAAYDKMWDALITFCQDHAVVKTFNHFYDSRKSYAPEWIQSSTDLSGIISEIVIHDIMRDQSIKTFIRKHCQVLGLEIVHMDDVHCTLIMTGMQHKVIHICFGDRSIYLPSKSGLIEHIFVEDTTNIGLKLSLAFICGYLSLKNVCVFLSNMGSSVLKLEPKEQTEESRIAIRYFETCVVLKTFRMEDTGQVSYEVSCKTADTDWTTKTYLYALPVLVDIFNTLRSKQIVINGGIYCTKGVQHG